MSDSRPKITARAEGDYIRINVPYFGTGAFEIAILLEDCFAFQCQLGAAMEQARANQRAKLAVAVESINAEALPVKFREWT